MAGLTWFGHGGRLTFAVVTLLFVASVVAALVTEAQTDPVFARQYRARFVEPRRDQARAIFRRAIDRGEIPADTKIEAALDLLYGPVYHRLLHGHVPLNDRFVRDVIGVRRHCR